MPSIVHTCSCGRPYSAEEWDLLPLVGIQSSARGVEVEFRLCSCGASMPMRVADGPWATALLAAVTCLSALGMAWLAIALLTGSWR